MKHTALLVASLLYLSLTASIATAADAPPNVIYFLIDDLGRNDCGFMGGQEIKTPHIDKLAATGATLDAYYVQPVCSPTRAALLTGRYPMRHGLQSGVVKPWAQHGLPLDERTIADDLKAAGYATGIFGKWHLGHAAKEQLPMQRGFTRQYGHYNGALDYFTHDRDGGFDWHSDGQTCRDEGYSTALVGEKAAEFVAQNAGKRPFFAYVPFNAVHSPYQPPKGGVDAYPQLKGQRRNYAAMLTATDAAIGEVIAAVDKAGVRDNTIFIFSSDNGGPSPGKITDNGKYRGGKGGLYEGGVRVAAFAVWPGHIKPGSTITESLHAVDWRPTLDKLCGATPTSDQPLDGLDASATLADGAPSPHDAILLNTTPTEGAIRAGAWKLIARANAVQPRAKGNKKKQAQYLGREATELFNLNDDPYEQKNLAAEHPERVAELRKLLLEFSDEAVPPQAMPRPAAYNAPAIWGDFGG
ncbi:arylsulfatase [Lacipirellula sp.]|uniref:arylsulfatase B n=1 Tax=Lacipirellula sp. TaxID=2691419 RepID=UPI003D0C289F